MSLVEWYEGSARCPGCGEVHYVEDQTKLLSGRGNTYRVGAVVRVEVDPAIFTAARFEEYWRLREPVRGSEHVHVLPRLEDVFECSGCERWLVPVLQWRIGAKEVCLEEIRLLEADAGIEREIDLVGEWGWTASTAGVADKPREERVQWLRERIAEWRKPRAQTPGWTMVVGPTQCEACGDVKERRITTLFTQPNVKPPEMASLFGPAFEGRTLYLGDRVHVGAEWQPTEYFYKVLRRVESTLTILTKQLHFGCACGAGRAAMVIQFARRAEELELVELALRVVKTEADLADVDVVEGNHPSDRAQIILAYQPMT